VSLIESPPPPRPDQPHQPIGGMTEQEQRSALIRLVLIVAAGVIAAQATGVSKTVAVIVAIFVMIMLHEFGHFITAKWAGMKVTEFFVGFGPRLWSVQRGETEYGVKAIPLGGYCKIIGMTNLEPVDPADEARAYRTKPYWRRLSVAVAGSVTHFLIAFCLLISLNSFVGVEGNPTLQIARIIALTTGESPAQQAGFRVGDRIVSVDGHNFATWDDVRTYISGHPGQTLHVVVQRGNQQLTLDPTTVDLNKVHVAGAQSQPATAQPFGFIGLESYVPSIHYGLVTSVGHAVTGVGRGIVDSVKGLAGLFTPNGISSYSQELSGRASATPQPNQPRFLSPVGFVQVAGQAAKSGLRPVIVLLILINLFVGVFNMVPLLPFDGGHVAIATYERIRSRKGRPYHADVAKMLPATYAVLLVLAFIFLSSLYLDVSHPVHLFQ
jgi:membrane-associated protease RseP (regulator of RpoE activity)